MVKRKKHKIHIEAYSDTLSTGLLLISNKNKDYKYTTHYNTILDITRLKDGSQKCIDYIKKWP